MRLRDILAALPILAAPALFSSTGTAFATDYYAAPPGTVQACSADGSQACPWLGVNAAFDSRKLVGGDRLLLQDGNYGGVSLYMFPFSTPVVIQSLNGKNAHFDSIFVNVGTTNLTFRNLSVWPSNPYAKLGALVYGHDQSSNIVVDGLDVRAGQDAANYRSWNLAEWQNRQNDGIYLGGPNSIVENSSVMGAYYAIVTYAANSKILNNRVEGFTGDAYRVLGDDSLVSGNSSANCFSIDGNHPDGIQSWAFNNPDGVVSGLIIEKNSIIEWDGSQDNPLRCSMQGIGFFDGPYQNVIIRNNLISVTQYHGVAVYGGIGVQILNNTVVNNRGLDGTSPWVGVFNQKDGTPAQNVLVSNNVAMSFNTSDVGSVATLVNNSVVMGMSSLFQDISTFNYRPTVASGFIDAGNAANAPAVDIEGGVRPYGAGPDRGAYEVGSTPTTGGTTTGTTSGGTTTGGTTGTTSGGTTTGSTTDGTTTGTTGGTTTGKGGGWAAKFLKPPKSK